MGWLNGKRGGTDLLLEHVLGVAVEVGGVGGDVVLELLDALLLAGLVLVVVGFFLDEAVDGRGGDGEGGWGGHGFLGRRVVLGVESVVVVNREVWWRGSGLIWMRVLVRRGFIGGGLYRCLAGWSC